LIGETSFEAFWWTLALVEATGLAFDEGIDGLPELFDRGEGGAVQ
jgi:hypothetical protein